MAPIEAFRTWLSTQQLEPSAALTQAFSGLMLL
jgi:hypothetical protein